MHGFPQLLQYLKDTKKLLKNLACMHEVGILKSIPVAGQKLGQKLGAGRKYDQLLKLHMYMILEMDNLKVISGLYALFLAWMCG